MKDKVDKMSTNRSQFSRPDRYSGSGFQHDSRETGYLDRTSQETSGSMWHAQENPSQFSHGSRTMSDRTHNYGGGGSKYGFQDSRTDTTSHTGQTSTPNIEKDLSKFLSKYSNSISPMETESKRLDTFQGGRQLQVIETENPTNVLIEPEGNSNRTRGPYYQSQNEMRNEWSHESYSVQSAVPFKETESYRYGDMSRHPSVAQGMNQGRDSSVPDTGAMQDLRMTSEKQHSRENPVDLKVKNMMKIVDRFSEEHRQNLIQSISAIASRSHRREEPAQHQESQVLKRGGSMYGPGDTDDSSFKRGRIEDFRDRPRPSNSQQTETWGRQQPNIQPREKTVIFSQEHRQNLAQSISALTSCSSRKEEPAPPQESQDPKSGGSMEDFRGRPIPSSSRQTETWGSQQPNIQPKGKPVPLLTLDFDGSSLKHKTFESRLKRLVDGIRQFKGSGHYINDTHTIVVVTDRCKIHRYYKEDVLGIIRNRRTFTGCLLVDNVFLARSVGPTKKDTKRECYDRAMAVLMTHSASEILKMEDEGIEKLKQRMLALENPEEVAAAAADAPAPILQLHEKLGMIINRLHSVKEITRTPMIELKNANISISLVLLREYKKEVTELWENYFLTKGLLTLDGHLIATAVGKVSKRTEFKTYAKGLEFLKYSPMSVVLSGVQADDDYTNLYAHDVLSHRHVSLPDNETEQKLSRMIAAVKNMANFNQPASNILQVTSKNNHLLLTCLLKKKTSGVKQFSECHLYIDCIYVCSGEGCNYDDAMKQANEEAVRVLSNSSSKIIFNDFKRITTKDVHDVSVVCEFWQGKNTKGFFWSNCENIQLLKKQLLFRTNPDYTEFPRDWESMIVMEQDMFSSDRLNKAYEILLYTATQNFVTLSGKGTTDGNVLKCELFLQGEKLAEAAGRSHPEASAKAAAKILFKFYQHQPVIKLLPDGDDSKSWHTYKSIKEKADKMKAESEDSQTDDFIYINDYPPCPKEKTQEELIDDAPWSGHSVSSVKDTDTVEQGDSFVDNSDTPSSTLPVNKWVKKVVEKMIAEYAGTDNLEELVFGPGFPSGDQRQIMLTASKHRIYSSFRTAPDQQGYVCVYQKLSPEMILKTLRLKDGICKKYALVPKEELPSLGNLEPDSFGIHINLQQSHFQPNRMPKQ